MNAMGLIGVVDIQGSQERNWTVQVLYKLPCAECDYLSQEFLQANSRTSQR
jgi:hypothetical protein